jgi:phospholipid/cholesterol/gamma-HCH transport system substrate-binding protein
MQSKKSEISVGIFLLLTVVAALFLCFRVVNLQSVTSTASWSLHANFNNIGGLNINSPVRIGGVLVGRVSKIELNKTTLTPEVTMAISADYLGKISDSSSLSIRTQGLLGEQYLALNPGFSDPDLGTEMLKDGSTISDTKSALVLEDLIGQFLYKNKDASKEPAPPGQDNSSAAPAK